jgi:hypothetical protein
MDLPSVCAWRIFAPATTLVAISNKIEDSPPAGNAQAIGFVPKTLAAEPGAITVGSALVIASPIMSSSTHMSAYVVAHGAAVIAVPYSCHTDPALFGFANC